MVGAAGVTIDLDGHVIQGADTRETAGVIVRGGAELQGAEVRGGTIRGFPIGVSVEGAPDPLVHDMTFTDNALGVACLSAPRCTVRNSVMRNNGGGIRMSATGEDPLNVSVIRANSVRHNDIGIRLTGTPTRVVHNNVADNLTDGVAVDNAGPVEIAGNVIARNGGNGIRAFFLADVDVRNNYIARNGANGVFVFGGFELVTQADVRHNDVVRNGGDGVLVSEQGVAATVLGNRTDRNGDDGIGIEWSTAPACCFDVVVAANRATGNADLGIAAVTQTTDGGANRARHNGDAAQCVGVSCK